MSNIAWPLIVSEYCKEKHLRGYQIDTEKALFLGFKGELYHWNLTGKKKKKNEKSYSNLTNFFSVCIWYLKHALAYMQDKATYNRLLWFVLFSNFVHSKSLVHRATLYLIFDKLIDLTNSLSTRVGFTKRSASCKIWIRDIWL